MKKRMFGLMVVVVLMLGMLPGCSRGEPEKLTLAEVLELSEKGLYLAWEDFEKYPYTETGSGLCIFRYPLQEEGYSLLIGGSGPGSNPPYYIYLEDENGEFQDIRYGGVQEFLDTGVASELKTEPEDHSLEELAAIYMAYEFFDYPVIRMEITPTSIAVEVEDAPEGVLSQICNLLLDEFCPEMGLTGMRKIDAASGEIGCAVIVD